MTLGSPVTSTVLAMAAGAVLLGGSPQTYRIDSAKSRTTIHVGKAGVFSFLAGHTHTVSGPILSGSVELDPEQPSRSRVRLVIATADLAVSPEGEPEGDAPKVQMTMDGEKVLDVARYPRITYESTSVSVGNREDASFEFILDGQLTIRDVTKPVAVPVRVDIERDTLTATGHFSVKQSTFGIKPISVGGVVSVKDELDVRFAVTAIKE